MTKPVYIHYGDTTFHGMKPIRNYETPWVKPHGGMWASRDGDPSGWKSWCEEEEFQLDELEKSFKFTLKDDARVLTLIGTEQLNDIPMEGHFGGRPYTMYFPDFEEIAKKYDAIELTNVHKFYWALYGWDCNCILITNPDVVEVIDEREN